MTSRWPSSQTPDLDGRTSRGRISSTYPSQRFPVPMPILCRSEWSRPASPQSKRRTRPLLNLYTTIDSRLRDSPLSTRQESPMPCRKGPGHSRVNEENKSRVAPMQRWLSKGGKGQDREALAKLFWKSSPPGQEPCLMWPEPSGVFNEPGVVMICRTPASDSDTFIGHRCTSRNAMQKAAKLRPETIAAEEPVTKGQHRIETRQAAP